ncbi:MAG TPA: CBS domain-containing protein [Dehalococcoidia bacterium]|nr:CBS domain-containing protein [Dehalococcoidia bacterium]
MAQQQAPLIDRASLMPLSEIIGSPIVERQGERFARVKDVVARIYEGVYPHVVGIVSRAASRDFFIPIARVAELAPGRVQLATGAVDVERFRRRDGELLLAHDVLDRQVIDVRGTRVVRVNDLYLSAGPMGYRVVALDTGGQAIVRRLVPHGLRRRFEAQSLVDWREVEYLASDTPAVRLRATHFQLRRLRPQQLARILSALSKQEGAEVLSALDEEQAADTLEEMSTEEQAHFLSALPVERAADLIEEMEPDEAADILAKVPAARAQELLERMEADESAAVRELLNYDPDTAGGAMTTNVFRIAPDAPVEEALRIFRTAEDAPDFAYYFFVLEDDGMLAGVLSLRQALIAPAGAAVRDVMTKDPVTVASDDEPQEVAEKIGEYNLLAIPVVDEDGRFLGAITVDDVLDRLLNESWRRGRSRAFGGG